MVDSSIKVSDFFAIKVGRVEAATSSQINESTFNIDNHTDTTVVGLNYMLVHDFEMLVHISG